MARNKEVKGHLLALPFSWYSSTMQTTIDSAGRIVVPKALRERLGLHGGATVEIIERGGRLEIAPLATAMTLVETDAGLIAVPAEDLPPLDDDVVRATLEQTRR